MNASSIWKKLKNYMIGVDFTGRLGNQMFTYAFARVLMEECGEKRIITPRRWFANPKWHSNLPGKDGFTPVDNI